MKLKFDPNQQFQLDAVSSVVDVFDGQPPNKSDFEVSFSETDIGLFSGFSRTELGVGNNLVLDEKKLLENINKVQEKFELDTTDEVKGIKIKGKKEGDDRLIPYLTVEMETGTGKTYVYLRTVFELNQKYGFKKFIIVVPSIAIREGVLKSIEITNDHFKTLYNGTSFDYFVYDSKKINSLRQFATSNQIQIMVINIDAFRKNVEDIENKTGNIIYRENDKLSGRKPIEFVQATQPIVIIDEPQSVDNTPKAKDAIKMLNPLCTLRYSATHLQEFNLLYKLDPIKAFELGLVKQVAVSSVLEEASFIDAYVKLVSIDNKNGISAKIELEVDSPTGPKRKKITVKAGDDLYTRSDERKAYESGFIVDEINVEPGLEFVSFTNGKKLHLDESIGGLSDEIRKIQIRNAVKEHLDKELQLENKGLKVLTLFFIDKVARYREYGEDGKRIKGEYAKWFEEEYNSLISKEEYKNLAIKKHPVEKLHDGYFAIDNKGREKDTKGESQADENAYNKIMKDKEKLLSLEEPLRFIFSHSALREGWDNPNVFQICTLNETSSELKKRQEIGRGLRIPVNQDGERVFDNSINKLVVIANEHYEDFARKLQTEYEEDYGIRFGRIPKNAFAKVHYIDYGVEKVVGKDGSDSVWSELWVKEYIDENGKILDKFDPDMEGFKLEIDDKYDNVKEEIINIVESYRLQNHIVNHKQKKKLSIKREVFDNEDFKKLWGKINQKTRFSVEYSTDDLVKNCVERIGRMEKIEPLKIVVRKADVEVDKSGVHTKEKRHQVTLIEKTFSLPDILTYLQRETELTRNTLFRILSECERLDDFKKNPQRFMDNVVNIINSELRKLMIDGIKYEKIGGEEYEMRLFEEKELVDYLTNVVDVKKSIYDSIVFDSQVERRFAQELDERDDIKLFLKLPKWFTVTTPLGEYNPDWAILKENDEVLYLVRETKGVKDYDMLRTTEAQKIKCGKAHFEELGVDFKTATTAGEI